MIGHGSRFAVSAVVSGCDGDGGEDRIGMRWRPDSGTGSPGCPEVVPERLGDPVPVHAAHEPVGADVRAAGGGWAEVAARPLSGSERAPGRCHADGAADHRSLLGGNAALISVGVFSPGQTYRSCLSRTRGAGGGGRPATIGHMKITCVSRLHGACPGQPLRAAGIRVHHQIGQGCCTVLIFGLRLRCRGQPQSAWRARLS